MVKIAVKLNLIVIKVSDLSPSVSFYESLGLRFVEEQHGNGPVHYSCDVGGTIFEIYPSDENSGGQDVRLGFVVDDGLDQIVGQLEENGSKVISHPKNSPWGRRAVIADPGGHRIELTEVAK